MSTVSYLLDGLTLAAAPQNLLFAFLGALLGTLVGVLPGIGPTSGIAILLPITAMLSPTPAVIMLAAIYYGAMYGGSTTAILVNTPGEVSSVVTTFDGYQLARQGKAGIALAIAAISSFVAGTLALVGLTFFAPPLADFALAFGPPEYFGIMCLAFSAIVGLSERSLAKGIISALAGFLLSTIGQDPVTGTSRFTFGTVQLLGGIDFISVVIGLFAISEIMINSEEIGREVYQKIGRLYPTFQELLESAGAILRSTVTGFCFGLLPGCTPGVTSFLSYDIEKKFSRHPEKFGQGSLAGVAAPEGANNACTSAGFIPLFSLGIPTSPALAVLLSALMIYGLQPGPILFSKNPDFVWTIIASMYIGNVMLLILNLPLVGLWARITVIPYHYLAPLIFLCCFVGAFSVRNNMFDVWMALLFGVIGYLMRKLKFPAAPLVLALILGPLLENSVRQSLSMSAGSPAIFITRPMTIFLISTAVCTIGASVYFRYFRKSGKTMA
ncbi:MAG: tripartite tricarboxylate transporter permease [Deltaproteobacteria bacterium]|nr:tripartite tricarboxylate transporter permease [Deltaproteobacteria bacterium]